MGTIFGRSSGAHLFDDALAEWKASINHKHKAMACNLVHDHRVSPEREAHLSDMARSDMSGLRCTGVNLQNALNNYFEQRVRVRKLPPYVYWKLNGDNILGATPKGWVGPKRDTKLVRVLDLSGLFHPYSWAKKRGNKRFESLPYQMSRTAEWIDNQLKTLSVDDLRTFLDTVFGVLRNYSQEHPFQPVWASTLTSFESHIKEGPDRWLEMLGMVRTGKPRWLVLLAYEVKEAGTIARPTQLEAGFWPYHYPSPNCAEAFRGGHPIDLGRAKRALLPEFVHKEIPHNLKHFECGGSRCGPTTRVTNESLLEEQRCTHYDRLVEEYGLSHIESWMSRANRK